MPHSGDKDKPLYMISVAAELTGMHPQTLRVYEQKGLVTPGRSRGNTRLYSQSDIERLNLISKLTDEGINLAGVVRILDMRERMLEREAEIDELRARVRQLEEDVWPEEQRFENPHRHYLDLSPAFSDLKRSLLGQG